MTKSFQECSDSFGRALDEIWATNPDIVDDAAKYLETRTRLLREGHELRPCTRILGGIAAPYDPDKFEWTYTLLDALNEARERISSEKIIK